jgi:hypothetical protein
VKAAMVQANGVSNGSGAEVAQQTGLNSLDQLLALLNARAGDRYLFSGRATDTPAVETLDHILNGNGSRAGLKQLINERNQADLGADGRGRLTIGAGGPNTVQIDEQATTFGFKLGSITSTVTGATTSGPTGLPASMSIDFSAAVPNPGETVTVRLNLPDGTSEKPHPHRDDRLSAWSQRVHHRRHCRPDGNQFSNGPYDVDRKSRRLGADRRIRRRGLERVLQCRRQQSPTARGRITAIFRRDRHGGRHDRKHGDLVHRRNGQRSGTFDGDGAHRSVLVGFLWRAGQ